MAGEIKFGGITTTTGFTGNNINSVGHTGDITAGTLASFDFAQNVTFYIRRIWWVYVHSHSGANGNANFYLMNSAATAVLQQALNFALPASAGWASANVGDVSYATNVSGGAVYSNVYLRFKSTTSTYIYFSRGTTYSSGSTSDGGSTATWSGILGVSMLYWDSPNAVTNLTASSPSAGAVTLSFTSPSDPNAGYSGVGGGPVSTLVNTAYAVQWDTNSSFTNKQWFRTTTAASTAFNTNTSIAMGPGAAVNMTFTKGVTYYFRMGAQSAVTLGVTANNTLITTPATIANPNDQAMVGRVSPTVSVYVVGEPDAPTNVGATSSPTYPGMITVSWDVPAAYGGTIDMYHVYDNNGNFVAQVDGSSPGWSTTAPYLDVTGLATGAWYAYYVYAHNQYGWSVVSALSSWAIAPGWTQYPVVSSVTPSTTTSGSVTVAWTAASAVGNSGSVYYRVYANGAYVGQTSGLSYTVTDLILGTTCSFYVEAWTSFYYPLTAYSNSVTSPGAPYIYNGSTWVRSVAPHVYTGSAWVPLTSVNMSDGNNGWKTTI